MAKEEYKNGRSTERLKEGVERTTSECGQDSESGHDKSIGGNARLQISEGQGRKTKVMFVSKFH